LTAEVALVAALLMLVIPFNGGLFIGTLGIPGVPGARCNWRLHLVSIFHHPETWKTFKGLPNHAHIAILQKEVHSNIMSIPPD
jgi:hypothetical protein